MMNTQRRSFLKATAGVAVAALAGFYVPGRPWVVGTPEWLAPGGDTWEGWVMHCRYWNLDPNCITEAEEDFRLGRGVKLSDLQQETS